MGAADERHGDVDRALGPVGDLIADPVKDRAQVERVDDAVEIRLVVAQGDHLELRAHRHRVEHAGALERARHAVLPPPRDRAAW